MPVSEPLPHFVDDLLGYLHETHPTHATLDGIHVHDDLLEDFSRHAIDAETRALSGYLRRLDERVAYAHKLIDQSHDFSVEESMMIDGDQMSPRT